MYIYMCVCVCVCVLILIYSLYFSDIVHDPVSEPVVFVTESELQNSVECIHKVS